MGDSYQNYVDGVWTPSDSGRTFEDRNPADPDDVVGEFPDSAATDAERAIAAASDAADEWAATPSPERGRYLRVAARHLEARADELADLLVREEGKARAEATGEVRRAVDIFYYYAEKARDLGGVRKRPSGPNTDLYTVQEPVGVAALITPWNYPIAIPAWKLAPALATGNSVVLKPAPEAPAVAHELARALDEAGLPDGVLNVVSGGADPASTLVGHADVDAVSFTGSSQVGELVYQEATDAGQRAQTEMGGKNPTLVTASADPEEAADVVASGGFGTTGQSCTATSRALVHTDVHDEFVDALVERADSIDIGPGDEADMGPQVSERERDGTLEYVDIAEEEGATLAAGGGVPDGLDEGYFVEPTVFTDVDPSMRIAREEVFGPVVAVIEVESYAEGLTVANDVDYGLSASVVTDDHTEAKRFADDVEAGVVKVNEKTTGLELHVPFGGVKDSSSETWREQGDAGLDFYTVSKTVYDGF